MLGTRLWMGAILIVLTAGMLVLDQHLAPWFPFLFVFLVGLALAACREMIELLGPARNPQVALCYFGVALLGAGNWLVHLPARYGMSAEPWALLLGLYAGLVISVFLWEMATFTEAGRSVERMALTVWLLGYLGLLPCFLAQLRWLYSESAAVQGSVALALAIFVAKCCDIGAYTTGRLIGRHRMTPVLSPKKTWEGAAGGLTAAVLVVIAIDRLGPEALLKENLAWEIGFGLTVGIAGMLGDLAESLIKRDCQKKDASAAVPGFGGVLDVVDSVIFAAPVAYLWLVCLV